MTVRCGSSRAGVLEGVRVWVVGALAVGAAVFTLYCAFTQEGGGEASVGGEAAPVRLRVNPDGSVAVWFKGQTGVAYQIFWAERLAAPPGLTDWRLVADDLQVGTNGWVEWVDQRTASGPEGSAPQSGFYRVVPKFVSRAAARLGPATGEATAAAVAGPEPAQALRQMREREMSEILALVAGGPSMELALEQKLTQTSLSGAYLLELLKRLAPEQRWAERLILEAVVGPRSAGLKSKPLARARLLLGWAYLADRRHEAALRQLMEVVQSAPEATQRCEAWVIAGRVHKARQQWEQARHCWEQAMQFEPLGRWPQEALWLTGLSWLKQGGPDRALEAFLKLAQHPQADLFRADAWYWVGRALEQQGRWLEAYAAWGKVMALNRELPRSSPWRSQYNRAEKMARAGWARIASHLPPPETLRTNKEVVALEIQP